jgi:hypothetical protein
MHKVCMGWFSLKSELERTIGDSLYYKRRESHFAPRLVGPSMYEPVKGYILRFNSM